MLECLTENHIFNLYINLMFRSAQKSEHMVLDKHNEKVQYLQFSLSYYTELINLLAMVQRMLDESTDERPQELRLQLGEFINSRTA